MVTIGIDPHKDTHSAVAVDGFGRPIAGLTRPAVRDGFGELLGWARQLGDQRAWVIEDCRHVSGPFERFLLDHGESVIRLPPHLMASARRSVRERGKSPYRSIARNRKYRHSLDIGAAVSIVVRARRQGKNERLSRLPLRSSRSMLRFRIAVACVAIGAIGLVVGAFSAGAASRNCASSQLRAEFAGLSAAAGRVYQDVRLANHGPQCTLRGWPALSFLGASGAPLSLTPPARVKAAVRTVTLNDGGHGYFTFKYTNKGFCSPRVAVSAIRLTPPGDRHPLVLHRTFSVCTPNPGAGVYPIRSTRRLL